MSLMNTDKRTLDQVPSLRDTATMPVVRPTPSAAPRADDRVLRYAPLLRFSRHETHFPIDPAAFVARARLRRYGWSDEVRDAVWHPRRACWEAAVPGLPASAGAGGLDIGEACRLIQFEARGRFGDLCNRRPCDPGNLWQGRRAGYALELDEPLAAALRGVAGRAPWLCYDRYTVPTSEGVFDVITYWFFFALNPHAVAHEGDWERVSVIIPEGGRALPRVRYASGRGAITCGFDEVEVAEFTHPVVYVEPGSHGMHRGVEDLEAGASSGNTVVLRTWTLEAKRVPTLAWSSFDGAWGRVGAGPRTTGPLGPLFRREDVSSVLPS